ncbi:hypothetical protein [Rhizobium sp. CF142]|uniref:hypothetical protein n=1 Tax=Rhizobium sp. CF142 TaxID=1144314 RepID=UPI0002E4094F|nr:hypothetical protein [Rhizobium sp. CF142]
MQFRANGSRGQLDRAEIAAMCENVLIGKIVESVRRTAALRPNAGFYRTSCRIQLPAQSGEWAHVIARGLDVAYRPAKVDPAMVQDEAACGAAVGGESCQRVDCADDGD